MMMPGCHIISLIIIIITLNLVILSGNVTSSNEPHFVHHDCSSKDNSYTQNSVYEANLNNTLVTVLLTNASLIGFSKFSNGEGVDQLHALSYCRGDIKGQDCYDCFEAAATTILQRCHLIKEGIIWYEECTLRYSNRSNIFSDEEVTPSHRTYTFSSTLKNLDQHKKTFDELMNSLIIQGASYDTNQDRIQGFATGETSLLSSSQNMILRGLVQCRPDIATQSCETCLRSALKQMDGWSTTMVFLPSCNLRFDLYPSQISPPTDSSGRSSRKVVIPVAVVVGVLLCCLVYCIIRRRRNRGQAIEADQKRRSNKPNDNEFGTPNLDVGDTEHQAAISDSSARHMPHQNAQNLATIIPEPSAPPLPHDHVNWKR